MGQVNYLKNVSRNLQGLTIGVPKETLEGEARVAITPNNVIKLVKAGAFVRVETSAGELSGFSDIAYTAAGAEIAALDTVWKSEVVAKVLLY
jgi:alanine dehydrogenase